MLLNISYLDNSFGSTVSYSNICHVSWLKIILFYYVKIHEFYESNGLHLFFKVQRAAI